MVDVTIVRKRADSNYFQQESLLANSYVTSFTGITQIGASSHVEKNRLTDLDSRTVTIPFKSEFPLIPFEDKFEVYRMKEEVPGEYRRSNVLFYQALDWLTTAGFEITIESEAMAGPLEGIIIEYKFSEITTVEPTSSGS